MKKFEFKLEKVLRFRAWSEESARLELGRLVSERNLIDERLAETARKRAETMGLRFECGHGADANACELFLIRLESEKKNLLSRASELDLSIEEARGAWIAAKAELKALESLKEGRFELYRKNMLNVCE